MAAIPEEPVVRHANVNDLRIAYRVQGRGPPLVMIMGLGGNMDWWDPRLVEPLARGFRTVLFDNRGTRRTEGGDRDYSIELFAEDTAGLMDALGIPRASVLGLSMGGMIAQELALHHPEKVERLVLCSTSCGGAHAVLASPEVLELMAGAAAAPSAEEAARVAVQVCFTKSFVEAHADRIDYFVHQFLRAPTSGENYARQAQAIVHFDAYDRLPGIRAPTLVVHGQRDILIPPENGSLLAQAIPGAQLVVLDRSAHGLSEQVDEAARAVAEFLAPAESGKRSRS